MAEGRRWPWLWALAVVALAAACGGRAAPQAPGQVGSVQLTDPSRVPTASPWATPPPVTYLGGSPVAGVSPTPGTGGPCGDEYVVQAGDVPVQIAQRCGVTLEELLAANPGLDPTRLRPGDRLKIPRR